MRTVVEVLPESLLHSIVNLMVRLVEAAGAMVIVVGAAKRIVAEAPDASPTPAPAAAAAPAPTPAPAAR